MRRSCKICWIILAVFFIGNLVVFLIWLMNVNNVDMGSEVGKMGNEKAKEQWRQQFMEKVDWDTAQYKEFVRIRNQHMQEVRLYHNRIDSLRNLLMNQTFSGENDSVMVNRSIDEITELQKQIEIMNFYHYKTIRSKCKNDEQRARLDKTFRQMIDRPRGRHRRGRGPH